MKYTIKFLCAIVLIAVIGFTVAECGSGGSNNNSSSSSSDLADGEDISAIPSEYCGAKWDDHSDGYLDVSVNSATHYPAAGSPVPLLGLGVKDGGIVKKKGVVVGEWLYLLQNGDKVGVIFNAGVKYKYIVAGKAVVDSMLINSVISINNWSMDPEISTDDMQDDISLYTHWDDSI